MRSRRHQTSSVTRADFDKRQTQQPHHDQSQAGRLQPHRRWYLKLQVNFTSKSLRLRQQHAIHHRVRENHAVCAVQGLCDQRKQNCQAPRRQRLCSTQYSQCKQPFTTTARAVHTLPLKRIGVNNCEQMTSRSCVTAVRNAGVMAAHKITSVSSCALQTAEEPAAG